MRKIVFLFLLISFTACEKNIDLNFQKTQNNLVVDATIENGKPPIVILSSSFGYFSKIDKDSLAASFVHGADIRISDGTKEYPLVEDSAQNTDGFNIYFYTSKPNPAILIGQLNGHYTMSISSKGVNYSASTTIPPITTKVDSVWWDQVGGIADSNNIKLMVMQTDRKGMGDYIRYFTKVNSGQFLPGLNSVFADEFTDGEMFSIFYDKGVDKNNKEARANLNFNRGDTITFKLCNIDQPTFNFWRTYEYSYQGIGNPFSSPVKILSNIDGPGFGYFGGYAAQYRTLIIPK